MFILVTAQKKIRCLMFNDMMFLVIGGDFDSVNR